VSNFKELGVEDYIIKALVENNIIEPSEIQLKTIPFLLGNRSDFIGQAQTGTGKQLHLQYRFYRRLIPKIQLSRH